MFSKKLIYLFILLGIFQSACIQRVIVTKTNFELAHEIAITKNDVNLIFVPAKSRMPAYLSITQIQHYQFSQAHIGLPFKRELVIDPLMYDANLYAQVKKDGKVIREFEAQKVSQTVVNQNQRVWTPARSKLSLVIPYLKSGEEVILTTTYTWMDTRWHSPIYFEESVPTLKTTLNVDIPFGVKSHFQVTDNGVPCVFTPTHLEHKNLLWGQRDNEEGLGTRFIFQKEFLDTKSKTPAQRMQLFFTFESPTQNERNPPFDNWGQVASYLYNRIDRYDYPSQAIREFSNEEAQKQPSNIAKIVRIFSFLNNDIERRAIVGPYLEQSVQPATKTFAKRFGSPFDIAILAKAMFTSLGYSSELLAISSEYINPDLITIFSPALFYSVIVAVTLDDKTYYYDPSAPFENISLIPENLYGARMLTIRKEKGELYIMPKKAPANANEVPPAKQALSPESFFEQPKLEPNKDPLLTITPPHVESPLEPNSQEETTKTEQNTSTEKQELLQPSSLEPELIFEDKVSIEGLDPSKDEASNEDQTHAKPQNP